MCLSKDLSTDQKSEEEADHVGDLRETQAEGGQTAGKEPQSVSLQTLRSVFWFEYLGNLNENI